MSKEETISNNLIIDERRKNSVVILDLKGQIRLGAGNLKLRAAIVELVDRGAKNVLLNLEEVTRIDSSGLGEIIAARAVLTKKGGELKLLHLTRQVRELMVITKLLTVLDCYKTELDAVTSFGNFLVNSGESDQRRVSGLAGL